ncbi:hypothetical protein IDSA_08765 [Pseudidiomarina salinarum]|uniref:homoserine dehydrogenase n=1 Tax=Pseudidiomarina salinarum TaxID=435908 RepID=A0A094IXP4_9GAMM|nr:hypothetical protein [Pseudidiomarina salinarum]KFZ30614.1 hypothetical protein IDSA_08765 [Pseudidiomarina salinarum]RUO69127.1 hypothetical protein CWI79_09455 [Pseudidiomarina salinarum]
MRTIAEYKPLAGQQFAVLVVGVGQVGSCWLDQFAPTLPPTARVHSTHNSSTPLTTGTIEQLNDKGQTLLVLDLTASEKVSRCYPEWIRAGANIISANKYAGAADTAFYQEVQQALQENNRQWLYRATVGAGVPIPQLVRECTANNDPVLRVEGNFSGSLTWIFQQYRPGDKLSEWLRKASEAGITEPDPRTDLGGMDVAKKLLIVAREAGWDFDLAEADIQNLVLASSLDEELDAAFDDWRQANYPDATQFCYIGRLVADGQHGVKASAALEPVSADSPYAGLAPDRAYFQVWTADHPAGTITVEGPGAGLEATAGAVHKDILEAIAR